MIDHQIDRHERVDLLRVLAEPLDRVAHRRQIDDARHAGKILHDHARGHKRQLVRRRRGGVPRGEMFYIVRRHKIAVLVSQERLEKNADRKRQSLQVRRAAGLGEPVESINRIVAQGRACAKTIFLRRHWQVLSEI